MFLSGGCPEGGPGERGVEDPGEPDPGAGAGLGRAAAAGAAPAVGGVRGGRGRALGGPLLVQCAEGAGARSLPPLSQLQRPEQAPPLPAQNPREHQQLLHAGLGQHTLHAASMSFSIMCLHLLLDA